MNNKNQPTKRTTTVITMEQSRRGVNIPMIRIRGFWLEQLGINIGSIIEIEVKDDCLILRKTNKTWAPYTFMRREMVEIPQ